jgi:hypothetical protein
LEVGEESQTILLRHGRLTVWPASTNVTLFILRVVDLVAPGWIGFLSGLG